MLYKVLKRNIIKLGLLIALFLLVSSYASAHNSYEDFKNYTSTNVISVCLDQFPDKILLDNADFMNVLPDALDSTIKTPQSTTWNPMTLSLLYTGLMTYLTGGVWALADLAVILDMCTNAYTFAPHEYVNYQLSQQGKDSWNWVKDNTGVYVNVGQDALTVFDIPFFFHCNPYYNPKTGQIIPTDTTDPVQASMIGRTWGYMPPSYPYCNNPKLTDDIKQMLQNNIPNIYMKLHDYSGIILQNYPPLHVNPSNPPMITIETLLIAQALYRLNTNTGKFEMCIATNNTFLNFIVGCTSIPPIHDKKFDCGNLLSDDRFASICQTVGRCRYLTEPRYDLQDLGSTTSYSNNVNWVGPDGTITKNFLKSDMHLTSTAIGCIKDMLVKFFLGTQQTVGVVENGQYVTQVSNQYVGGKYPQFQQLFSPIAFAVLTLYVSMVAINMLLKVYPENLSRPEMIMYVLKLAIFYFFVIGDGWMSTGLFQSLLDVPGVVGEWFLEAQNVDDPLNACYLNYNGSNLLGENVVGVTASGQHNTEGYPGNVVLTVWDLVDCKMMNYLTLGSCDFSLSGLIVVWLIGACIFAFPTGLILGIIILMYSAFIILMVFRIASVFILAMIALTILAFVSPIFFCFWLFNSTKDIFNNWARMVFGYTIYPACLFAFLALLLATFDSVFYGIDRSQYPMFSDAQTLKNACNGVSSVFCTLINYINTDNLCTTNFGYIVSAILHKLHIPLIGDFYIITNTAFTAFFAPMLKIMFMAVIFYLFMGPVNVMLARMVDVINLADYATENFVADTINIVKSVKNKVMQAAKQVNKHQGK